MSAIIGNLGSDLLGALKDMQREQRSMTANLPGGKAEPGTSFTDLLTQGVKDVDAKSKVADKAGTELATGRTDNLHETMLAATQAELSFNLMVQLRNKGLEAYTEIMRMPV